MKHLKISSLMMTGALLLAAAQGPAHAASVATNLFLNNLVPNVDFLDRASRFALENSKDARLRAFAHDEAAEQTNAANAVDDWITADKAAMVATTAPATMAPATTAPALNAEGLATGRSVAIDRPAPKAAAAPLPTDPRLAMGQEDLDSLEGLEGKDFDTEYKRKQRDALGQIETDYRTYLSQGDDPALLSIAKSELPKIEKRIAELGKL
jgi:predicted outer membrane protein